MSESQSEKVALISCPKLTEILNSNCDKPLTQDTYSEFQTKYMNQFFASVLKQDESCLGGRLEIAIREPKPNVFNEFRIISFQVDSQKCNLLDTVVIPVFTHFAPFDFSRAKTSQEILDQYDELQGTGHFTVLIVNKANKEIEYFETNGSEVPWIKPTESAIKAAFTQGARNKSLPADWNTFRFVWPGEFCPNVSWQGLAQTETCAYWSTLFAVLRINCIDVSREKLVDSILGQGKSFLLQLMQAWHCYMWLYSSKHHILQLPKIFDALQKRFATRKKMGGAFGAFSKLDRNTQVLIGNKLIDAHNRALDLYSDNMDSDGAYDILSNAITQFNRLQSRYKNAYSSATGSVELQKQLKQEISKWVQ